MKFWERGIACGLGHEKNVGLGHTLMGYSRPCMECKSREKMVRKMEREEMELAILVICVICCCFRSY